MSEIRSVQSSSHSGSSFSTMQQPQQIQYNQSLPNQGPALKPTIFIPPTTFADPMAAGYVASNFPQYKMENGVYPKQVIGETQSLSQKTTGKLKFFDEAQNFGFIVVNTDETELFVHYDDLKKANVTKETLLHAKYNYVFHFSFIVMTYYGKHKLSKKAVELQLLMIEPPQPTQQS